MDLLYKLIKKKYSVEEAINKLESEKYLNSNSFRGKIVRAAITISPDDYYLRATTETNIEIGKIMPFNQLFGKDSKNQYNEFCTHLFKIREINDFSLIEYLKTHNAYNEKDIRIILVHLNNFTYINHLSELRQHFKDILDLLKLENENSNTNNKPQSELSKIWLRNPIITVEKFLKLGIEKQIWDEQYKIISAKGKLYGTGKSLLGNLSIALKEYAISENTDYKEVGKAFCNTFNIQIKENTKEPFKAFCSGNDKQIILLKKAFNIK